jgi:hypothetical protein
MSRIRGYLVVAIASSALTALGGAGGLGASARANPPVNTSKPSVAGTAAVGQTLSASAGSWTGATPMSFSYRWIRCDSSGKHCGSIGGATHTTYRPTSDDLGHRLVVRVRAQNSDGAATAYSDATSVVAENPDLPRVTAAPTISGQPLLGSQLTGHDGSWTGKQPLSFSHLWQRCDTQTGVCNDVGGATHAHYTIGAADVGTRLRFVVTARNSAGSSTVGSPTTATIEGKPAATAKPTISGTAQQGATLTASTGTWAGTQPIRLTFQWQRCDANGNACVNLSRMTRTTYVLTSPDVGHRMRVHVHAENSKGAAGSTSDATAVVAPAAPPPPALPPGAVKLPDGTISIPVTSVSLPDQLIVDKVSFAPAVITSRAPFQARFHVVNTKGYVVRDALVYILGIPYGRILNVPEQPTAQDGWVTMTIQPTARFPLVRGGSLVIFVRARKPGDNLLAGVSARRLVQVTTSSPR